MLSFFALGTNHPVRAATSNILDDGFASVPKSTDVASAKYAVVAQFVRGKSKLELSGVSTKQSNKGRDLIVEPGSNLKGKIKAVYTNVATYKGKSLDFEMVVADWDKAGFKGGEWMVFQDSRIGFTQSGYTSVSIHCTYLYHDTGKPATDLTGSYMTVNDLDTYQYVSFDSGMMKKIDKIYAYDGSKLSHWTTGSNTNIGAKFWQAYDTDDRTTMVTFLISGYQFNFSWCKDWSEYSSIHTRYDFNKTLDWKNEDSAQYFSYLAEKPIRTEILTPTKEITDTNGKETESSNATVNDPYRYTVYHTVPAEFPEFYYKSYVMQDTIHKALSIKSVKIYNSADEDVTKNFTVSTSGNTVKATAKSSALSSSSFYGQDYRVEINVAVRDSADLLDYAGDKNSFDVVNKADVIVDGKTKSTNEVTTKVTLPKTEIGMKHIKIYTNKASAGLPVYLDLTHAHDYMMYKDEPFTIDLYRIDGDQKTKVTSKTVKLGDLDKAVQLTIPTTPFMRNDIDMYEADLNVNKNHFTIPSGKDTIDAQGHVAAEETLSEKTTENAPPVTYKGIVMTEREIGGPLTKHYETISIDYLPKQNVKSGYGFQLYGKVSYANDIMSDEVDKFKIARTTDAVMNVDHHLIDKTLSYYDATKTYRDGEQIAVPLSQKSLINTDDTSTETYQAPHIYLAQDTGMSYTEEQKKAGQIKGTAVDAGNQLYVPVWISDLGTYTMTFENKTPLGINAINFKINSTVDVTAYMFAYEKSRTIKNDELLIEPVPRGDASIKW